MSTNIWHILGAIIIILASIRGALVLHFGFPPTNTYQISALSFILLGFFSFLLIQFKYPNRELILLINVINLNVFFLSFYLVGMISLLGFKYIDMVYLFGIFPIIFWLIEYKHKLLILIVYSALFITGFGVIYFYYVGITSGINGVGEMITTLRPNTGPDAERLGYSRIGEAILPGGYQANHHDAAQIIVMGIALFFSKFINASSFTTKCFMLSLFLIFCFLLLLTGSTANTLVAGFVILIGSLYYIRKNQFALIIIITFFAIFVSFLYDYIEEYLYFYSKLTADYSGRESGGIYAALNLAAIYESLPSLFFGMGVVFNAPMIKSEVGFLSLLSTIGLLPFILTMFICFSPVYYILNFRKRVYLLNKIYITKGLSSYGKEMNSLFRTQYINLIMASMPVLAGSLTLIHYGSLFRITSIGLFCVFLALFFKEYLIAITLIDFEKKKTFVNKYSKNTTK